MLDKQLSLKPVHGLCRGMTTTDVGSGSTAPLDHERALLLELCEEDGLVVAGRGLALDSWLLATLTQLYSERSQLVLVLHTEPTEAQLIVQRLQRQQAATTPDALPSLVVTAQSHSCNQRAQLYRTRQGVLFVTARILVVDLLTERLPAAAVTGVLLPRAHRLFEATRAAFVLRLLKERNRSVFVKAWSESPEAFTQGYAHVERIMRNLFVRRLYLWPRFHTAVVDSLQVSAPEVEEIRLTLSADMIGCQTALLDLLKMCLLELRRANPQLDLEELSLENALTRGFDGLLRATLDPIWHQLSWRSRQLAQDIKSLKMLLYHLVQHDAFMFYQLVESLREEGRRRHMGSGWLLLDQADKLVWHARRRVQDRVLIEPCPKWTALKQLLREHSQSETAPLRTLVLVEDSRTVVLVEHLLRLGQESLLKQLPKLSSVAVLSEQTIEPASKRDMPKPKVKTLTLTQMLEKVTAPTSNEKDVELEYPGAIRVDNCNVVIAPIHGTCLGDSVTLHLEELLRCWQPQQLVLYDPNLRMVRHIEVWAARCWQSTQQHRLKVKFLLYADSSEEQRYLTSLRREKEALEMLIDRRSSMALPELDHDLLERPWPLCSLKDERSEGGRHGGLDAFSPLQQHRPLIVVDTREFRSELPVLLHRRGLDLVPRTLEVSDYVLTPDMCVERKSLPDLVSSLQSGRLYQQCLAMSRAYKRPLLLLEFSVERGFALAPFETRQHDDVLRRLVLLTLHFPQVRLLWSATPYVAAELMEQLKGDREQPQPDRLAGESSTTLNDEQEQVIILILSLVYTIGCNCPFFHLGEYRIRRSFAEAALRVT